MWVELDSSKVPVLHDWLAQAVPSHWTPSMHSINRLWPRFEPLILGNRLEE